MPNINWVTFKPREVRPKRIIVGKFPRDWPKGFKRISAKDFLGESHLEKTMEYHNECLKAAIISSIFSAVIAFAVGVWLF